MDEKFQGNDQNYTQISCEEYYNEVEYGSEGYPANEIDDDYIPESFFYEDDYIPDSEYPWISEEDYLEDGDAPFDYDDTFVEDDIFNGDDF